MSTLRSGAAMSLYRDAPSTPGAKAGALRKFFADSEARCAPTPFTRFRILRMKNGTFEAGPPIREIQRQGCVFVRQPTQYPVGRATAVALQYY